MLRIFTAPVSVPGQRTLQADAATWQALIEHFPRTEQAAYTAVLVAVRAATGPDRARRVTLPDAIAAAVLAVAGVSA